MRHSYIYFRMLICFLLLVGIGLFLYFFIINPQTYHLHTNFITYSPFITPPEPTTSISYAPSQYDHVPRPTLIGDQIYLSALIPSFSIRPFHSLSTRIAFQHPDNAELLVGVQKNSLDEYQYIPVYNASLEALQWSRITSQGLTLYQKNPSYTSVQDFITHPPSDKRIATYAYATDQTPQLSPQPTEFTHYQPLTQPISYPVTLRGSFALATYINQEPLHLELDTELVDSTLSSQTISVTVSRIGHLASESQVVYTSQPTTDRHIVLHIPDLSRGVYQIAFRAGERTSNIVCTRITTMQRYLVTTSELTFLHPMKVFTDADQIYARLFHPSALQEIRIDGQPHTLTSVHTEQFFTRDQHNSGTIETTKDHVVIHATAPLGFSSESFFHPYSSAITSLDASMPLDLEQFDYILTSYQRPQRIVSGSQSTYIADITFPMDRVRVDHQAIALSLYAPHLTSHQASIGLPSLDLFVTTK